MRSGENHLVDVSERGEVNLCPILLDEGLSVAEITKHDIHRVSGYGQAVITYKMYLVIVAFLETRLGIVADFHQLPVLGHIVDLCVAHGEDLAGTYTIGKRLEYKAGTFYPGMWFGTQTLGTFCMQVNSTSDIKFCAISDGKVDIVKNADETYSVTFALTDEDGYNVSGSWTGNIEDFAVVTEPETNLESDVVMTPTQCSSANYYGDYYATGSANYGIVFNTDDETLAIDFIAASGDASEIPAGTYTVASGNDAWTVCPGSIGFTSAEPSCYIQYETTGLSTDAKYKAPIVAGTMTVSKTGSTYTFEFEFYDDYDLADKTLTPHKISGKYTGTIPAITDYTKLQ